MGKSVSGRNRVLLHSRAAPAAPSDAAGAGAAVFGGFAAAFASFALVLALAATPLPPSVLLIGPRRSSSGGSSNMAPANKAASRDGGVAPRSRATTPRCILVRGRLDAASVHNPQHGATRHQERLPVVSLLRIHVVAKI